MTEPVKAVFGDTAVPMGRRRMLERRELYRDTLLKKEIPWWQKRMIDRRYGGFLTYRDADGTLLDEMLGSPKPVYRLWGPLFPVATRPRCRYISPFGAHDRSENPLRRRKRAMLKLTREGSKLGAETMGGRVVWDAARGGQISNFCVNDDLFTHPLLADGDVLPDLRFVVNGKSVRLAEAKAEVQVTHQEADHVVVETQATLCDGALSVMQRYEVHEEGAVFCDLSIEVPSGKSFDLGDCFMTVGILTEGTKRARWGCFAREPAYKVDYSTIHAFVDFRQYLELSQSSDQRDLLPYLSLDLGWAGTRFFSNHLELILEDRTAFDHGPLAQTRTFVRGEGGKWLAGFYFNEGRTLRIAGPKRYRNCWGMLYARARTHRGADADPAVRNNCLGARICHVMYPYARAGTTWPWASMPIKQIPEQPPQLFRGNPEVARVDEAADLGADTMVIHQFWMRNPGSNNEPPADYIAFDPAWFKAFVDRCHQRGLRVVPYVRGTEMYQHYATFFEDYCRKDADGLYADWNTPFCMGYVKCSPLHVSGHNYFHFTKAMRRRVGSGGVLIGHTSIASSVTTACFDVALGGEVSVRHDELLTDPESCAYYSKLHAMGAHLISGNLPDRIAFSSPRAAALCAALGMASHPFMEPDVTFADRVAFIKPLWDALRALPGPVRRLHNPAYAPTRAVRNEQGDLFPSLWQAEGGRALLLVTNLAEQTASGVVELSLGELDAKGRKLQPLKIAGAFAGAKIDGSIVRLENIPSLQFAAVLIG